MPFFQIQERIGTLVAGKYHLLSMIGEGGMGAVFEAEHMLTHRRVAVKLIKPEYARVQEVNLRFVQEARTAAAIGHRNIVQVLDAGEDEEGPYMVLELLEGETLCQLIERRPAGPREALEIMAATLDALRAAHNVGVIHRDIKPENIFLVGGGDRRRDVKLLDFGISKILSGHGGGGLTRIGTAVGTPDYMSPEQASGGRVDGRADLWSVGAVLYEAIAQALPFEGDGYQQLLARILTAPHVPLSDRVPAIPPGVSALIDRALAKDVAQRFASAEEMLGEVRRLLAELPPDESLSARGDEPTRIYHPHTNPDFAAARTAPPDRSATLLNQDVAPPVQRSYPPPGMPAPAMPPSAMPPPAVRSPSRTRVMAFGAGLLVVAAALVVGVKVGRRSPDLADTNRTPSAPMLTSAQGHPDGHPEVAAPPAPAPQPLAPTVQPLAVAVAVEDAGSAAPPGSYDASVQQVLAPTPSVAEAHPARPAHPASRVHPASRAPSHPPLHGTSHRPRATEVFATPAPPSGPAGVPLSPSEVMDGLRPLVPAIQRCAQGQGGNVVGAVTVDDGGAVRGVRLDPPFGNSPAAPCVTRALGHARFPRGRPTGSARFFVSVGR